MHGDEAASFATPAYIVNKIDRIADQMSGLAGKAEVAFLSARMDSMVPRSEHDVHWKRDDDRFRGINDRMDSQDKKHDVMNEKIDRLLASQLPPWFLTALGIAIAGVTLLANHFWRP